MAFVSRSRALFSSPCAPSPSGSTPASSRSSTARARLGLAEGVDLLALQDPAGDLRLQHQAEHEDDGRRERQRADDHPHLQRPAPDRVDQRPDLDGDGADLRDRPPARGG